MLLSWTDLWMEAPAFWMDPPAGWTCLLDGFDSPSLGQVCSDTLQPVTFNGILDCHLLRGTVATISLKLSTGETTSREVSYTALNEVLILLLSIHKLTSIRCPDQGPRWQRSDCKVLLHDPLPFGNMAFEAPNILVLVLFLVWKVLNDTPDNRKHGYFKRYIPSLKDLDQIISTVSLEFAPGLWNVLRASTPPTVQYFKTLPTTVVKRWGIYLLVLEKVGCRPRIYIGSGTEGKIGLPARFTVYGNRMAGGLPHYAKKSFNESFGIAHLGLLCWTSIPPAGRQPIIRLTFAALEATFTWPSGQ
jgi:hypothetical protein